MNIEELRKQIDEIDAELIDVLARRAQVVTAIGTWKKQLGLNSRDDRRFQEVLEDRIKQGKNQGIPADVISKIWHEIHDWALSIEDKSK